VKAPRQSEDLSYQRNSQASLSAWKSQENVVKIHGLGLRSSGQTLHFCRGFSNTKAMESRVSVVDYERDSKIRTQHNSVKRPTQRLKSEC
jgi:hypothetical protein